MIWLLFLANLHFVSVIIVLVESGNRVSTHFYCLLPLGTTHTAQAQFSSLKAKFQQDRVWSSIKRNIASLVVDGAAVNLGLFFLKAIIVKE